jgi:prepilin-type N-terminal cleavage/methylation domain-containing protein
MQRQRGLTLLELLVVLAIIAISSAGVALAMRDNAQSQLEREAQRLIAKLEAARVQSRAQGLPLVWRATGSGFVIETPVVGSGFVAQSEDWLSADISIGMSAGMKDHHAGARTDHSSCHHYSQQSKRPKFGRQTNESAHRHRWPSTVPSASMSLCCLLRT